MTIAYFDCNAGVAGDMVLGALVDAGMPLSHLKKELSKISIGRYEIKKAKATSSIKGTNLEVLCAGKAKSNMYVEIDRAISGSRLPKAVKTISRSIFDKLAGAEARVHGIRKEKVHFHEVGAIDSIVDIVGAAIGIEYFGFDAIYSSPLPMTRGSVKCDHGTLPVPAPATLELMRGIPLEPSSVKGEIVTPTGAAILTAVAESFGESPLQFIESVGYGYGDRVIPGIINALRLMIGEGFPAVVIQTNIDDMNPQIFDHVIELLFKRGAVDVDLSPCQMKKNRPAVKLSVLAPWQRKDDVMDLLLKETSTFGVRYWPVDRKILTREFMQGRTRHGKVNFKVGYDSLGKVVKVVPEYEDMKKVALKTRRPLIDVYTEMKSVGLDIIIK